MMPPARERKKRYLVSESEPANGAPGVAVGVGDLVFVGGAMDSAPVASIDAPGDVRAQARSALEAVAELVERDGGKLDDIVEVTSLHSDARSIEPVFDVARELFESDFPAWTPVAASAQALGGALVTISAIARLGDEPKQCIVPDTIKWWRDHPASAGCRKGDLLFVAGQYGSDADGNVNTPGDHAGQARNALNRVREICELAGGGLDDVIDVVSFHQDPRWIEAVDAVYESEFFDQAAGPCFPAWTTVGTPGLLRLGMLGQYRAIADLGGAGRLGSTPADLGWGGRHLCGAAMKDGGALIAVSGGVATDRHGEVTHRGDPEAQAHASFELMQQTLTRLGATLDDVVAVTSFHLDPSALEAARRAARDHLDADIPPAWTAAGMSGFRRQGQLHAIHALAVV